MGGPTELIRAREVPPANRLPRGRLHDACREVRQAVARYDEIKVAGRALVDRRREVHAADDRSAAKAMQARMGHAATEHLATYAHVVKALEGRPHHADLDALIFRRPRRPDVPVRFPNRKVPICRGD